MRNKFEPIAPCLGYKHSIKGIIMNVRKIRNVYAMSRAYWKLNETHLDCKFPCLFGSDRHLIRMLRVLDRNFPKRYWTEVKHIRHILKDCLRLS